MDKEKKMVYVLSVEWNVEGGQEFEVLAVFDTKEQAVKALAKEKLTIVREYTRGDTDYQVEEDTETSFQYSKNEWDKYYIATITEKELNKEMY